MPEYVEIAVNVPSVSGVFHYHLPLALQGRVRPGHLALVPFGPQMVQGVVLRQVAKPEVPETKAVEALLDDEPVLNSTQIQLAEFLAESTLAPLAACINLMLPPGFGQLADFVYELTETGRIFEGHLSAAQGKVWKTLRERGALRGRQLDRALPRRNWRSSARALLQNGLLTIRPVYPAPKIHPKTVRTIQLNPSATSVPVKKLGRGKATQARRSKILEVLARENKPIEVAWLFAETSGNSADLKALSKLDLIRFEEGEKFRNPLSDLQYDLSVPLKLTADQSGVWSIVESGLENVAAGKESKPILLHGVTGSGKTEIYLRAVAEVLKNGRSAIVLVPEIALTPQTAQRFLGRFPGQVGLLHSELSDGERFDTWRRARSGDLRVIVGPRSALFAPLSNIGLIVVDEEHDDSYYEAGQMPHYHAREAAVAYARMAGAQCLLGSATPDVGSYTRALQETWVLQELPARILAHRDSAKAHQAKFPASTRYKELAEGVDALELPDIEIMDMRTELRSGNRSIFSRSLQTGLEDILHKGQQAILFLNRRGTATYVFCRNCGHVLRCPNCDNPLTQHLDQSRSSLVCHHCGYQRKMPQICPSCNSPQIRHFGTGTETVEAEVRKLFPRVRTLRWDRSSTQTKRSHEKILAQFTDHQADVLVGTQMLAKGLDLPYVTLVGVVLADVGLQLPDYRAAERVFQVLTQVAGRAGRSPLGGRVVLQTFLSEHYAIRAAAKHDYKSFYQQESALRKKLRYPPFSQLLRLEYRHADARKAEAAARGLGTEMERLIKTQDRRSTDIVGPAPCFYGRLNREYRWQILLRGPDPASLLGGIKLTGWRVEVNPPSLL